MIEVLPDAVAPHLLVLGGQLHLHLAVVSFHVLGQVESGVGVRLPIKLQKQRELGEKLANLGSKLLIIAAALTILDMVDLAWSISASQVSGRRKQPNSREQLQHLKVHNIVFVTPDLSRTCCVKVVHLLSKHPGRFLETKRVDKRPVFRPPRHRRGNKTLPAGSASKCMPKKATLGFSCALTPDVQHFRCFSPH